MLSDTMEAGLRWKAEQLTQQLRLSLEREIEQERELVEVRALVKELAEEIERLEAGAP